MTRDEDRTLRDSVPERHKSCTSPVGAVQNYIAELEQALCVYAETVDVDEALEHLEGKSHRV